MTAVMPIQKPGRSVQIVGTPDDFLAAFKLRFGPVSWDLAANEENSVADLWLGPGSDDGIDSLSYNWSCCGTGNLWLNPPFGMIPEFARKALHSHQNVNLLVPLSSSNWARDYVWGKAYVYLLNPRLTFRGHTAPYPKDMMLVRYGLGYSGCELWRWK